MKKDGRVRKFCPQGHNKDIVGRTSEGSCLECRKGREKVYGASYYLKHKAIILEKQKIYKNNRKAQLKELAKVKKQRKLADILIKQIKMCVKCKVEKRLSDFGSAKNRPLGLNLYCKDCVNSLSLIWKRKNREKHNAKSREWHRNNRERSANNVRNWRKQNSDLAKEIDKNWRVNNRARRSHNEAKRRVRAVNFGQDGIVEFYDNRISGMEVDHIIPLINKFVSGLHVVWNLQYLESSVNRKKRNKVDLIDASNRYGKLLETLQLK